MSIQKLELCGKIIWQVFGPDRLLAIFKTKREATIFMDENEHKFFNEDE
jgi:hypothetical protein